MSIVVRKKIVIKRKKVRVEFNIYEDQHNDLLRISENHNGQYMSDFVRAALDVAITKEKSKEEIMDYN